MKKVLTLELPIPPSINRLYTFNKYIRQKVYKKEGRKYLDDVTLVVRAFVKKHKLQPISDYFYLECDFFLANRRSDSHNYKKLIFDVLKHGGLIEDDNIIMDRTQSITIDKENPRVILSFKNVQIRKD